MNKTLLGGILLILLLLGATAQAQQTDINSDTKYNGLLWEDFVQKVEKDHNIRFFYTTDSLSHIRIDLEDSNQTLLKKLELFLDNHNIKLSADSMNNVFLTHQTPVATTLPKSYFTKTSLNKPAETNQNTDYLQIKDTYVSNIKTIGKSDNSPGKTATISGHVRLRGDNSPVVGATLFIRESGKVAICDHNGYFTLKLDKGTHTLELKSIETEDEIYELRVISSGSVNFLPELKMNTLNEILITSEKFHNVRSNQMGFEKLSVKSISGMSTGIGENDVVKVTLLLPGVQSIGEGSSGFNVRGSPIDQNLFYINYLPVYNASHFLGFFSSFNSNAIKEFTLYKSSVPVEFGGRLASVFDIKTHEGDSEKFSASGGISPFTANLLVEGPIIKDRLTYLIGARSTYSNWIFDRIEKPAVNQSSGQFADGVANFTFSMNANNKFEFFAYGSTDNINLAGNNTYDYQNYGAVLSWNRLINGRHNLDTRVIRSNYKFDVSNTEQDAFAYRTNYALEHNEFRSILSYHQFKNHDFKVGINSVFYRVDHGKLLPLQEKSLIQNLDLNKEQAIESGIYINDEWTINERISLSAGMRYNHYMYLGPNSTFTYISDAAISENSISDTLNYKSGEIIRTYANPDVRVSTKFLISPTISIKAGYTRLIQHIFLLSNTIVAAPNQKWKLADHLTKPMKGDQYSTGFYWNFGHFNSFELSAEFYYKTVQNFIDYKEGADVTIEEHPEWYTLQGNLDAFGTEIMLKKRFGKFNGWINYTYSNAQVHIQSEFKEQEANLGEPYPANYDKPHAVNLVSNYEINRRISFSGNVVYSTGRPITYPASVYYQDNMPLLHYTRRNEYRIPDYFRIDLALKIEGNLKASKIAHGTWKFSVYNLTGRKNAYSVFFKSQNGLIKGYKMSIFGVPIFSVSYNFKLGNYADKYN